jgi:vacuolar-type H+-ATPase subunit D/Vma8
MKRLVSLFLCLSLSIFTVARATKPGQTQAAVAKTAQKKPTGQKADAKTLLDDANKALAAMIKAARADQGLDPKTPKSKPFWKSIQLIAKNLKMAKAGLASKSNDFFKGIAEARQAEEQLKVDWELTDSKNSQVIENGKKLGHAIALLRTDFSKEAARKKKGGELTANEKAEFDKIKAQQKELLAKIAKLKAAAKKDKALEKGLREMEKQANHIINEPVTLDAYIATLYLLDGQIGLIRGYEYYVDKPWRTNYLVLVDWVHTYDSNYYDWETSVSYDWSLVDTSVDIYENDDATVSESVSDEEINSEEAYAEHESFDMSEAEEQEVAAEEDTDEEVASADDDSMDDASDDEGEDVGGDDDSGGDDSGDDNGGDDGGDDGGD